MKTKKTKPTPGRFVISKSSRPKKGFFTEEVVYKVKIGGVIYSQTVHERI